MKNLILTSSICFFIVGCAVAPTYQVPQPWYQINQNDESINLKSKIKIEVSGNNNVLIGDNYFIQKNIKNILTNLLERRGYIIDENNSDYQLKFNYKIGQQERINGNFVDQSSSSNFSYFSTNNVKYGIGILAANIISSQTRSTERTLTGNIRSYPAYDCTIALEIYNKNKEMIWKSDSILYLGTMSFEDTFENNLTPIIQKILSSLPKDESIIPRKNKINPDKALNYFKRNALSTNFTSPALPYRFSFSGTTSSSYGVEKIPLYIKNPEAFDAYIDLMLTTEYVLPVGSSDYSKPLEKELWSKIVIGGKYFLGNDSTPSNILINLKGTKTGYVISKCEIVNDQEYEKFNANLDNWKTSLKNALDFNIQ